VLYWFLPLEVFVALPRGVGVLSLFPLLQLSSSQLPPLEVFVELPQGVDTLSPFPLPLQHVPLLPFSSQMLPLGAFVALA